MARILVVSDNPLDYRTVAAATLGEPHYLEHTASGLDGCMAACASRPDVVVIGERTSDQDGLSVMRHLRTLDMGSLLVMPLEQDDKARRMAAYEAGADDTLPRPLDVAELSLRLRALLRHRQAPAENSIAIGRYRLDRSAHLLYVDGQPVALTPREYAVLDTLMVSPGATHTATELLDTVWGSECGTETSVRMVVQAIRRKAGEDVIQTVNGFGYRVAL